MNQRFEFNQIPDWERVEVSAVNRMPAHTSSEEAARGDASANIVSLNGTW